ncbi:MAG: Flp pilus assembly protein CpaB [Duganella sp.]
MKTSSIFLLAGALTLAAGTALVARSLMRPPPPVTIIKEVSAAAVPDVMVLSAAQPLLPGDFIGHDQLAWRKASSQPAADHITATTDAERINGERALLGAALRHALETDMPITRKLLVQPGEAGFIAAVLGPGMRAISIPTSALASNAGLVSAGDYVDVILSLKREEDQAAGKDKDTFRGLAAETILRNVRVLALNSNTDSIAPPVIEEAYAAEDGAGNSASAKGNPATAAARANRPARPATPVRSFYETITLEVAPAAAEKLAVAKEIGTLQVALRGTKDQLDDDQTTPGLAQLQALAQAKADSGARTGVTRLRDTTTIFGGRAVQSYRGATASTVKFE